MKGYSSREVLNILDVRAHVLRYWEQTLPIVRATRDDTGHRIFTAAQVRMLQRIRHLVVDRGISVNAAGQALVAEAGTTYASVKGNLEAVREELIGALRAIRASGEVARTGESVATRGGVPTGGVVPTGGGTRGSDGSTAAHASPGGAIPVESVGAGSARDAAKTPFTDSGTRQSTSFTDVSSSEGERRKTGVDYIDIFAHGVVDPKLPRRIRDESAVPDVRPPSLRPRSIEYQLHREDGVTRIAYRHLLAYGSIDHRRKEEIPSTLDQILRYRLYQEGDDNGAPIIVAAPECEVEAYRAIIRAPGAVVLPVSPVGYGDTVSWYAPLLGTLLAILLDDRWRTHPYVTEAVALYFFSIEAPDAPFNPPIPPLDTSNTNTESSVSMVVHPLDNRSGNRSVLLGEGWVVSHWTPKALAAIASSGRWTVGPVLHRGDRNADTFNNGWRYDVWLRDLIAEATELITVLRADAPSLWRGDAWIEQIGAVWPPLRHEMRR